ncbi:single-stranded DNA-binding protein [Streptomyces albus subsp. chlorinus]|uniref:single-stranded DNA-binding protein n=1 Tax=Streptomyces albus TaxID=1888 RepID=UPI00157046E9|nr:single-stranded DNA-binding protein [Streptomyces albus subsp. chlorinus]
MNETQVTVIGNVATKVEHWISTSGVPVARFRLASTVRRFDKRAERWTDVSTSFYTVWAWRTLAGNVASSVSCGEPVVVRGQLRIVEEEREGRRYLTADLMASTVGHDLSRGTSAFVRGSRAHPELTRGPAPTWPPEDATAPAPFGPSGFGGAADEPGAAPGMGTLAGTVTATGAQPETEVESETHGGGETRETGEALVPGAVPEGSVGVGGARG